MAGIMDYLAWRGDLSFEASPFNEVDNYLFAKIGTADFGGIVPPDGPAVGFNRAVEEIMKEQERTRLGTLASKSIVPATNQMTRLERYAGLKLWGFESVLDADETEQFAALTLVLPDGTIYVSFRGTDDTIVAWKEDFLIGVQDSVKAQRDAGEYLKRAAEYFPGPIIVGGHSKGGNLAVYAAVHAPVEVQDRIIAIYNNDGPGFTEGFLKTDEYLRVRDRINTIISQRSIVGTLLVQDRTTIVKTNSFGVAAHDGFNWEVLGPAFVRCPSLGRVSTVFDEALQATLDSMNEEERRTFVDAVFDILYSTGAETLSEFSEKRLRKVIEMAKGFKQEQSVRRFLAELIEQSLKELKPEFKPDFISEFMTWKNGLK